MANPKNRMNPEVDEFIKESEKWKDAYKKLRSVVLDCEVAEEFKWKQQCYTFEGKNIVLIQGFKEYCAYLFPKGVLLKDPHGMLIQQTENVQAARQIRFTNVEEIEMAELLLKDYIDNAIEVEKAGLKVKKKETDEFPMPEEFQAKLDEDPALKDAFEALTPGRQRGYLLYFSQAKQVKTRERRIEKYTQHILDGKGFNDR